MSMAYVRWNATEAGNLRVTGQDYGVRYTQDMRDANNNVDADGYWASNFPSPAFDRENDATFPVTETKNEEAEVTATSSSFPAADKLYWFYARYSHWSGNAQGCGPIGDNGGGSIGHNEHMSQYSFGEWNTYNFTYSGTKYVSYPYVCVVSPCTSVVPTGEVAPLGVAIPRSSGGDALLTRALEIQVPDDAPFRAYQDDDDAFIQPDLAYGLENYRVQIHDVGRRFMDRFHDQVGMLTFIEPQSMADLADLQTLGVSFIAVEAIGTDEAGDRFSAGAPYSSDAWRSLASFLTSGPMTGRLEGVVAAEVVVADRHAFDMAVSDERVYSVDMSGAITMTHAQMATYPEINDLYWYVAGWEPPH